MLEVVTVDTNPEVLRKLTAQTWSEDEALWAATDHFLSAEDALLRFEARVPDIVVTELLLPGMDGLLFMERLKARFPYVEVIIHSERADFFSAQSAIEQGVFRFLHKPVPDEQLQRAVRLAAEKVRAGRALFIREQEVLFDIFTDPGSFSARDMLQYPFLQGHYFIIAIELRILPARRQSHQAILHAALTEVLNRFHLQMLFIYRGASRYYFYVFSKLITPSVPEEFCYAIHEILHWRHSFEAVFGVSKAQTDILNIRQALLDVKQSLRSLLASPGEVVGKVHRSKSVAYPAEQEEELIEAIRKGNDSAVDSLVTAFLLYYRRDFPGYEAFTLHIKRLGVNLLNVSDLYELNLQQDTVFYSLFDSLDDMLSMDDVEAVLITICCRIAKDIKEISEPGRGTKMQRILAFIQANVSEQISLQAVADYAGMSPVYLSKFFKTETGQNFVDFLTELRINKAKQLLTSTNHKVAAIAEAVGIRDSKYFSSLFKRCVGMTPIQYRENY